MHDAVQLPASIKQSLHPRTSTQTEHATMNWRNTKDRYGSLSIGLHWLMLLLLVGVYAAINLHEQAAKGSVLRAELKTWHFVFGLSVLALVAVRLAARLVSGPAPGIEPPLAHWQQRLATWTHVALYVFMIGMPLLGWLVLSAADKPVPFFGMRLPALVGPDKALAHQLEKIHETIGTIGYYLIGLHAAAALVHHYLLHDDTLRRMLPMRRRA
jgi:cytochrome b561